MPKDQTQKWREAKQRYRAKQREGQQNAPTNQEPSVEEFYMS